MILIIIQDSYFTGGQSSDFGANFEIKLSNDPDLYQTERWGSEDFSYDIPIVQNGKYVLILKFSEELISSNIKTLTSQTFPTVYVKIPT